MNCAIVSAVSTTALAASASGHNAVRAWGSNGQGQRNTPTDLGRCTAVAAGVSHTLAITVPLLPDSDGDGIPDATDNCPTLSNPLQADCDANGIGATCQPASNYINSNSIPGYCECIADLFVDQQVNGADLGALLSQWGRATAATVRDLNRDGVVNGADLGYLLANWSPCPN